MKEYLSKEEYRKFQIIKLLDSENRTWSSKEIAGILNVSKKTVLVQMQYLFEELKYWNIQIITTSKGYRLSRNTDFSINQIFLFWMENDLGFKFFSEFFYGKMPSLDKFIAHRYISLTQFYSRTKKLKEWFRKHDVCINSNNKLTLRGSEKQIRYCYFHMFWNVFKGIKWPFYTVDRKDILNCVEKILELSTMKFNQLQIEQACYAVAVCIVRMKNENIIKSVESEFESLYKSEFSDNLSREVKNLLLMYDIAYSCWESEIRNILILLAVRPLSLGASSSNYLSQLTINSFCKELTDIVLEELMYITDLRGDNKLQLIKKMNNIHVEAYHFSPILVKKDFSSYRGTRNLREFKSQMKKKTVYKLLEKINEKYSNEDEILCFYSKRREFLTVKYEEILEQHIEWEKYIEPIKIHIQMDSCIYMNQEIEKQIQWLYPEEVEVVATNDFEQIDLSISSSNIMLENSVDFLAWSNIPNENDWARLDAYINNIDIGLPSELRNTEQLDTMYAKYLNSLVVR